jgi:hypothetical protein
MRSTGISAFGFQTTLERSRGADTVSALPALIPLRRGRPACGWRFLAEDLGRCPRRASSGFHTKSQTPFRVKGEREDGVAFSAPEKPPDAAHPPLAAKAGLPRSAAEHPGGESDEHRR